MSLMIFSESFVQLKGARHPCVELQEGMDFIPNEFNLVFGESSFLLVTGPNMGESKSLPDLNFMCSVSNYCAMDNF